jgi:hypothetical protein
MNIAVWLVSAVVNSVFIVLILKKLDTDFEKEVGYLTILTLIIFTIGQWINMMSVLAHKGFEHGFSLHLATEGGGWAYSFYGIGNILLAYSVNHILKKYNKKR